LEETPSPDQEWEAEPGKKSGIKNGGLKVPLFYAINSSFFC
jgi:hypothetical protein